METAVGMITMVDHLLPAEELELTMMMVDLEMGMIHLETALDRTMEQVLPLGMDLETGLALLQMMTGQTRRAPEMAK